VNLRPKTGLIIGGTFLVLLGLQFIGSVAIISRNIRDVELSASKLNVERVRNALEEKICSLNTTAGDYATWDDAYNFMQTGSPEFLQSNFEGTSPLRLEVNLILILNDAGIPVFEKELDLERRCEVPPRFRAGQPFPVAELLKEVPAPEKGVSPAPAESPEEPPGLQGRKGLIRLGDRVLLVACRPIVKTDGSGPSRGFIVFGRELDTAQMAAVAGTTNLSCSSFTAGAPTFIAEQSWLRPLLEGKAAVATRALGADVLAAYAALDDITGQPVVYLRVQMPRDMHHQGWIALRYFAFSLLVTGVIVAGITLLLMQRVIITRLLELSRFVIQIGRDRSVSRRVVASGSDELSALAGGINEMLASLERADSELRTARARAEDASRAKGEFLANMSHEIRTPMSGILGMTRILINTGLNPPQQELAGNIDRCAQNLLCILNAVLDYSKIEAGKLTVEAVPFDLLEVVEDLAQVHGVTAAGKSVALTCRYDPAAPRAFVGDPGRVRQVLGNLLGNAVKFTEQGEVGLEVTCVERDAAAARIRLRVRDTGVGIPSGKLESIFDKFEQADTSTTRRFGGTGLGLAISRQLVQLLGGTIQVESEPGRGSVFSVELPLPLPEALRLPSSGDPARDGHETTDLSVLRVLVVTARPSLGLILEELLHRWRVRADLADSPDRAWGALADAARSGDPFAAVFVDHEPPQIDGVRFAVELRDGRAEPAPSSAGGPAPRRPRVVLMSSGTDHLGWDELVASGAYARLQKPVRRGALMKALVELAAPAGGWQALEAIRDLPGDRAGMAEELPPFSCGRGGPPRILLAEDNPMNQKVALYNLERFGCAVDVADNGLEAVEMVAAGEYDLVLMDCFMPGMDGPEATATIRRRERGGRRIPILAMTAGVTEEERRRCLEAGMDGYLGKPVDPADLHQALARHLGQPMTARRDLYPDDPEMVEQLVRVFLRDAPPYLDGLEKALEAGDLPQVVFHAHALKGMAGNLKLQTLVDALQAMEQAGKLRDLERARADLPVLRDLFLSNSLGLQRTLSPEDEAAPRSRAA
jgi:signal transduction histidine kinase/DNA-binding response OmpR family regulator